MTNRQKQHLLAYLGFYQVPVDGIWGQKSQEAEQKFRQRFSVMEEELATALKRAVAEEKDIWEDIRFFKREEFRCTCGGRGCNGFAEEPSRLLVNNGEMIRKFFGRVVRVSSGVRCPLRNEELPGSAANSLHLQGRAMDFAVAGVGSGTVLAYVKTLPGVVEAYAIDANYVHMGVEKEEGL